MPAKKIILRVREETGCPLFRTGDQMVLDFPGVDKNASTNICTLALAKYMVERPPEHCERMTDTLVHRMLVCPRAESPVIFDVLQQETDSSWAPMMGSLANDVPQAVAALRTVPIFRSLPAAVLGRLAAQMKVEKYEPGQVVVERGSLGRAFFVVHEGALEVVGYADQEVSSVVTKLKPRDCFGEMSLLTGAPAVASVVASAQVTLLALPKDDFERLLRENTYMASSFTRLLASRLMSMNVLLVKEGSKTFSGKLQEMSLPTVLQVLADSNRSGTLIVDDYQGNKGRLAFSNGRLFDAKLSPSNLEGEPAIFAMLRWIKGDFWLDKKSIPEVDKIDCSVMGLLLEGMRQIDETGR